MRFLNVLLLTTAVTSPWLEGGSAPHKWKQLWNGRGCPPGKVINGYLVEGTYLPIEFQFKFDPSTSTIVWISKRGVKLDKDLLAWFISKMQTGNAFSQVDSKTLLRFTFSGSTCDIVLFKADPAA